MSQDCQSYFILLGLQPGNVLKHSPGFEPPSQQKLHLSEKSEFGFGPNSSPSCPITNDLTIFGISRKTLQIRNRQAVALQCVLSKSELTELADRVNK